MLESLFSLFVEEVLYRAGILMIFLIEYTTAKVEHVDVFFGGFLV